MKQNLSSLWKAFLACLSLLLLLHAEDALAQATDASMTGVITDESGTALPGATVIVRNESTGFQTGTITNANGRFLLRQLPLGKPYTIKVSFVGYTEQTRTGYALNQGYQLNLNFNIAESATQLQQIEVNSNALTSRIDRLGASTAITSDDLTKLPVQNRNFNSLSGLSPLTNGTSIGSQLPSSTNFLVDGVTARNNLTSGAVGSGPYTISLEAIREFEVVANEYDVSQGRAGGGNISVVTKSGTNTWTGSAFTYYIGGRLASPYDIRGNKRTVDFNRFQYGFSLGGPIIKDKMHFFVALDRQNESSPFFIADIQDDEDANALGISRGALDSVITIGRELYGLSDARQVGAFDRKTVANTIFTRIDWQLHPKHRLTLRNNYSDWNNPNSNNDNSDINLFEVWGDFNSRENSTLASLRSSFSEKLVNELKIQFQHAEREYNPNTLLPSANIPRAIVSVRSTLPNGTIGNRTVQLGGQRFTPERNFENTYQLVNTTYLTAGHINFTFGTDNMLTYLDTYISNEQNGRFIFSGVNGLRDFANLNPARYAREVPLDGIPSVQQYVLNTSVFGQAQFNPLPNLTAQFGLRWDVTSYLTSADYNPVVERELGLRTDANPTDWDNIQTRLQLTWDINGNKQNILRAGAGIFSAYVINYAQVNNIQNSGTKVAAIDVSRPSANSGQPNLVPRPDFPAYRNDPSSAPGIPAGAPSVSTINLNDPNFEVPTLYKANITYNRYVSEWLRFGVNFLYSRTVNNYVYLDRNLVDQPYFTLDNENGRGVFVPANTITESGITNNVLGRKTQDVGRTLYFTNGAKLRTATLILDADMRLPGGGNLTVSYTWNDARDNTSYNGNVANTSTFRPIKSDPRDLTEINYSDNQFRHKLVVYGATPSIYGFTLSGRFSGLGGTRYSLTTDADINGDFVGGPGNDNDLAFVFDPGAPGTPENIAAAMNAILDDPQTRESAKKYIRDSFGQIADRNGGENPFSGVVDVRLAKEFKLLKTQGLELSVDVFNFANLLNKNWGGNFNLGNSNLLSVTGFDQDTQEYNYRVNQNAGRVQKSGTPYQIQLGARYSF